MNQHRWSAKSVLAIGIGLSLLVGNLPASASMDFSSFWNPDELYQSELKSDRVLLIYGENGTHTGLTNQLSAYSKTTGKRLGTCEAMGVAPCDLDSIASQSTTVKANLVMPMCKSSTSGDCVQSLTMTLSSGERVKGEFLRAVDGIEYEGNAAWSFPSAGAQLLFRVPGVLNAGGTDTYAVEYGQTLDWSSTSPVPYDFRLAVVPYVERADPRAVTQKLIRAPGPDGIGSIAPVPWNMPGGVIWMEDGKHGLIANFGGGVKVEVSINASNIFGGWIRGRLADAIFGASQASPTQQNIVVGGTPVEVPRLAGTVNRDEFAKYTKASIDWFDRHAGGGLGGDVSDPIGDFQWLEAIRHASGDKARAVHRVWMFASVPTWVRTSCYPAAGINGLVATNSALYAGGAPKFDSGYLDYKVAGVHYLPDGSKAIGTYDLIMRSNVARCLYGFTSAPISATVTVVGTGNQNIATSLVRESGGWLTLSAAGFTFSTKTIRVKVSQPKTLALPDFPRGSNALSKAQMTAIRNFLKQNPSRQSIVCTGFSSAQSSSASAAAIKARSKAACDFAKSIRSTLLVTTRLSDPSATSLLGRVSVQLP